MSRGGCLCTRLLRFDLPLKTRRRQPVPTPDNPLQIRTCLRVCVMM